MPRAPKVCGNPDCTALAYPPSRYCDDHHRAGIGWNKSPRTASSGRTSTTHWKQQRAKALQRDAHQCQVRGPRCTIKAVQVDHIIPVHLGGTDELHNLKSVCKNDHDDKTAHEARAARAQPPG